MRQGSARGLAPVLHWLNSETGLTTSVKNSIQLAAALIAAAAVWTGVSPADGSQGVRGSVRVSNEHTLTRWAHPAKVMPVRRRPRSSSHQIVSTHFLTEDRFPEVYIVLRRWTDPHNRNWLKIRVPMRPNGKVGWVREYAMGPLNIVYTKLIVNRNAMRATLYRHGNRILRVRVGVGKPSTPTPKGHFWIREKFRVHERGGPYGPAAFGTSDYSVLSDWPGGGIIGIHGTDEPELIPGNPSHGCIRMKNGAIRRLWKKMPVGTPLLIHR